MLTEEGGLSISSFLSSAYNQSESQHVIFKDPLLLLRAGIFLRFLLRVEEVYRAELRWQKCQAIAFNEYRMRLLNLLGAPLLHIHRGQIVSLAPESVNEAFRCQEKLLYKDKSMGHPMSRNRMCVAGITT